MQPAVEKAVALLAEQREELAELVLRLGNVFAPVGQEEDVAREIATWYRANGIGCEVVPLVQGRANVVARLAGRGGGPSLLFNAHLDTEVSGPLFDALMSCPDPNRLGAWREGDRIFGHTAINDRHGHALFMMAASAIKAAGVGLRGDLILTSVAGETGQAPVDEFGGLGYEGKGFGSSYLVEHGQRAAYALVAETTGFAPCWYHCGAAYYKVTLRGHNIYTPRLRRDGPGGTPNAIVKAAAVVQAIESWAAAYTASRTGATPCGQVRPNAQVGAIRGGLPWRPNRSSPYCALYVDVRLRPGDDLAGITASLREAVTGAEPEAQLDVFMVKDGALGQGVEPLVTAVRDAHRTVRGAAAPQTAEPAVVSMWRDTNVFNRAGIPAIDFGPGRGKADIQGRGYLDLDDLVAAAQMYVLTAARLAG
ncbi:MAG: peptidase dimerization domain-containing protein [bacterium]|jgi:acetylornithine deacetylase/succinyl-diaminopimelate desuccinylase-like protein|nr:peptidase dimerization domain-containing protein [bacterium]